MARAGHGASAAGQAKVGIDEGAVFRDLDGFGRTDLCAEAAGDAAHLADIAADGILVRAEDDDGVILQTEMDDALRAGADTRAAADAFALVDLGDAVGVQRDRTEAAGGDTGAAARAAVGTELIALRAFFCVAAAVAVDAGDLGGKFLFYYHENSSCSYLRS